MDSRTYYVPDLPAAADRIRAAGGPLIDLTKPAGQARADGVTVSWVIEGQQVTLTLVSKPWIIPASTIWAHAAEVLTPHA